MPIKPTNQLWSRSGARKEGNMSRVCWMYRLLPLGFACGLAGTIPVSSAQEIKKQTELRCPKDGIALMVAEKKSVKGDGNGFGGSLLKAAQGAAGAYNQAKLNLPPLPEDTPDPDRDYNSDATTGLYLAPRTFCYLNARDKMVVIGKDQDRVLVEVRDKPYGGPQRYPSFAVAVSGGSLDFRDAGETPACLNKTKLWIERDVFLRLEALPVPPDPKRMRKQQDDDDKAALRHATREN
jgi:hypothetical protein